MPSPIQFWTTSHNVGVLPRASDFLFVKGLPSTVGHELPQSIWWLNYIEQRTSQATVIIP